MSNSPSAIESLPAEARDQIISWLETQSRRKVLERIALPPPDGFGLKTHLTTLNRFYARHVAAERPADLELAKLLAPGPSSDPVEAAAKSLISDFAFHLATNPKRKLDSFKTLSYWLLRRQELEQREREIKILTDRLALDREKFEFNAARHALDHHAELGEILENPEGDNEDKINAARAVLFNRPVSELPK